jgi:hypothetical protein
LLAEQELSPERSPQELLPGDFGVPVEVVADAVGQQIVWRHGVESTGRKTVIRIAAYHEIISWSSNEAP